jgi:hypothetical protein
MLAYISWNIKEILKKLSLFAVKKRYINFLYEKAEKLKKLLSKKRFFKKYDYNVKEKKRNMTLTKKFNIKLYGINK